jgi:hypothetical protein
MSLKPVTDNIRATLLADTALLAWIAATFPGKTLKVIKAYKRRQEINVTDLPLIMITAPKKRRVDGPIGHRRYESDVLTYAIFHFDGDRATAPDLTEQFESLVEDALLRDLRRGGNADDTEFEDSANDEGISHPTYISVLQFKILTQRSKP